MDLQLKLSDTIKMERANKTENTLTRKRRRRRLLKWMRKRKSFLLSLQGKMSKKKTKRFYINLISFAALLIL